MKDRNLLLTLTWLTLQEEANIRGKKELQREVEIKLLILMI